MFEALRVLQILLWMGIVAWSSLLAWRLASAADGGAIVRGVRGEFLPVALRRACIVLAPFAMVLDARDAEEAAVRLEEQTLILERRYAGGLAWLRILGLSASALGFGAVAYQISWLRWDHGLLDLDPIRVGRMAAERAAVGLALAVAASGSAIAMGNVVRDLARRRLRGGMAVRRAVEREIVRMPTMSRPPAGP